MGEHILPVFLCLDDERIILDSLRLQLQRNFGPSFIYEFAESVDEAFEIIEDFSGDEVPIILIITDWLMPKMKGDEFLCKVHQNHPKIIKVMLTGQADKEAVERAYQKANLFRCIQKPWDEKELINCIEDAIETAKPVR